MVLEKIKEVIIENYGLLKDRLGSVTDDYQWFPIPEESLDVKFQDLKIEFSGIFNNSVDDYKYNGLTNTLVINRKYSFFILFLAKSSWIAFLKAYVPCLVAL